MEIKIQNLNIYFPTEYPDMNGRIFTKQCIEAAVEQFKQQLEVECCTKDKTWITAINKFFKVCNKSTKELQELKCTDVEEKLLRNINTNNTVQVYKNRQVGFTTLMCAYATCEMFMSETPVKILYMSPNGMLKQHVNDKVKDFITQIPRSSYGNISNVSADSKLFKQLNRDRIVMENGSEIMFCTSDLNRLRGVRADIVIIDEFDYYPKETMDYILAIIPKNGKIISSACLPEKIRDKNVFVWV